MHRRRSQQLQVDAQKWQKELEMVTPKRRRFKSRQTWALRHDAAGQCPECEALGPSPSSVLREETIAHFEPQIWMDCRERTESSAETSTSTRALQNYKGLLLGPPGFPGRITVLCGHKTTVLSSPSRVDLLLDG